MVYSSSKDNNETINHIIGSGRFSCVYAELQNDNVYRVKKVIQPNYEFEKKLLGNHNDLNNDISKYCNCLDKLGVNFAEIICISKEDNNLIMIQEYIEGILLKDYIKTCKNFCELLECFRQIINWVVLLKKQNDYYRLDLNLSNFIVQEPKKNEDKIRVVLVDLCPVLDIRKNFTLTNMFEKNLFQMKFDFSTSIAMLISYTIKDLLDSFPDGNKQQEIEFFYQRLLIELDKNNLLCEISERIQNIAQSQDEYLISDIRVWSIDQYMNHHIGKEQLDYFYAISSITKLRGLREKEQINYIQNIRKEMNEIFKRKDK